MRQGISALLAALAVSTMAAAPAMACGAYQGACSPCGPAYVSPCPQAYLQPAPAYSSCDGGCGGGYAYERLSDPVTQYYFANQGPTYTGPGEFAPVPTYQESAVSGWSAYRHRPYYYGYDGGRYANATNHYYDGAGIEGPVVYSYPVRHHSWRSHRQYGYGYRPSYRYGYQPHHAMRYGAMHYYGPRQRVLRRYY